MIYKKNGREYKRMQENRRISKKEETAFCCISSLWDSSFFSSGCFIGSYGNRGNDRYGSTP